MLYLERQVPVTDEVEVSSETLAAIDHGIAMPTVAAQSPSRKSEN
jgi:hypothetical protein